MFYGKLTGLSMSRVDIFSSQIFVVTVESMNFHSYAYSWLGLIIPRFYERETKLFHFRRKGPKCTSSKTLFNRVNVKDGGYLKNAPLIQE